ncbi:hypothetical protein HDV02_001336 [Globomyces sp. JEL0801]|nr:hypothetical protein HDV02_001336 [Globomyces sp. JEL0801]
MASITFGRELLSVCIAQLLSNAGADRIHASCHDALVDILQSYLSLMAKKATDAAALSVCLLDIIHSLDYVDIHPKMLVKYLDDIKPYKNIFKFPREEPASFPINLLMLQSEVQSQDTSLPINQKPESQKDDMLIDQPPIETNQDIKLEDVEMKTEEEYDKENVEPCPFPPYPTKEDENFVIVPEAQVPSWEILLAEAVEHDVVESKPEENPYFKSLPFEYANESFLSTYMPVKGNGDIPKVNNDIQELNDLLVNAMEANQVPIDSKIRPPIPIEDLLNLLSIRTSYGTSIPENNSSGYESKSILQDLLLLKLPGCHTLFGGEKLPDDGKILDELVGVSRKKKEKERDSGQGKAPVKMSAAKLAKREAALAQKLEASQGSAAVGVDTPVAMKVEDEDSYGIFSSQSISGKVGSTADTNSNYSNSPPSYRPILPKPNVGKKTVPVTPIPNTTPTKVIPKVNTSIPIKTNRTSPASGPSPVEITNCICIHPSADHGGFMICCDQCNVWFHGQCVNVLSTVSSWTCMRCHN